MKLYLITIFALLVISNAALGIELDSQSHCRLNILLTNDDGWNAPGIQALHKSLIKADHKVTLVAPQRQQSGQASAITTAVGEKVEVTQQSKGVWSVDGTPADSVKAALGIVMPDKLPDLTISGANFGPNLGQQTALNSGTIGAALTSSHAGIPAIAISVGLLIEERNAEPPFKSTLAGFSTAAHFLDNLINQLIEQNGCGQPMPPGKVLTANIPVPASGIVGSIYAPLSSNELFGVYWYTDESGTNRIGFRAADKKALSAKDDVGYFARGNITVSLISADLTASTTRQSWLPVLRPEKTKR